MHLIRKATGNLTQVKWKLKVIYYLLEVLLVKSPFTVILGLYSNFSDKSASKNQLQLLLKPQEKHL